MAASSSNSRVSILTNQCVVYLDFRIFRELANKVKHPQTASDYPVSMDTQAKRVFYDNLGQDEVLVTEIDNAIRYTKKADWVGDYFKEREIANAVREKTVGYEVNIERVMALAKAQKDYQ